MIRLRNSSLTVLIQGAGTTFFDISDDMWTYQRDSQPLALSSVDKLWIGFEKPITAIYPYMSTVSNTVNTMTVKYFNGTDYVDVTGFYDGTKGFTRNGFIHWDANQNSTQPDMFSTSPNQVKSTINNLEQFWYEISVSMNTSNIVMQGLNLIFADTEDLKLEFPQVSQLITQVLPNNTDIMVYESVRLDIVKALRAQPKTRFTWDNERDFRREPINQWDILNIESINAAARNLSLSKIYGLASTQPGDTWAQKADYYIDRYESFFATALLAIDYKGDGREDVFEPLTQVGHPTLQRD